MTFDIKKIAASKEAYRKRLSALPYAEKLRILDQIRERDVALRKAKATQKSG